MRLKILSFLLCLFSFSSFALETDQFMTWKIELNDSTKFVNSYIQENILKALAKVNEKPPIDCPDVAKALLAWNGSSTDFLSSVEFDLYKSPLIDRYPRINESKYGVIKESIYADVEYYKHKIFGVNLQTNGIYYGIDKLGHFLTVGLSYYNRYTFMLKKGYEKDEAIRSAVMKGVFSEKTYYGDIISGVFSFADLEANYQGLRFAINMCEGFNPHIIKDDNGKWLFTGDFDITPYVNPLWDESYNPSTYIKKRWNQVKPFVKKYCDKRDGKIIQKRFEYYNTFKTSNPSTKLLQELVEKDSIRSAFPFSLDYLCQ